MNAFPKMDFSKLGMPKLDPARTARMMERMARLQTQQAAAYARWAEGQKAAASAAEAKGAEGGATIDMRPPASPGEAWTAPDAAPGGASRPSRPTVTSPGM
jgi:hypothetical protein